MDLRWTMALDIGLTSVAASEASEACSKIRSAQLMRDGYADCCSQLVPAGRPEKKLVEGGNKKR